MRCTSLHECMYIVSFRRSLILNHTASVTHSYTCTFIYPRELAGLNLPSRFQVRGILRQKFLGEGTTGSRVREKLNKVYCTCMTIYEYDQYWRRYVHVLAVYMLDLNGK